jgi:hypothetical protein
MQISGNTAAGGSYDVAVAKKVQQSTRQEGEQALKLLEAAATPPRNASGDVGGRLNIVA